MEEDENNRLWIVLNRKIVCFDTNKGTLWDFPNKLNAQLKKLRSSVNVIKSDSRGHVWLGTISDGFIEIDSRDYQTHTFDDRLYPSLKINRIRDFLFTKNTVWIAARSGLFKMLIDEKKVSVYVSQKENVNSLSNSSICSLLQDNSGVIWIGTYLGGVNKLIDSDQQYFYFNIRNEVKNPNCSIVYSPFYDSTRNTLWIGTGGGGLDAYNFRSGRTSHTLFTNKERKSIDYNFIESLCLLPDHELLVGTLLGLFLFNPDSKRIDRVLLDKRSTKNYAIFSMKRGKNGTWIGTQYGLFFRWDNGEVIRCTSGEKGRDHLSHGEIFALCNDKNQGLWIGYSDGLSYWDRISNKYVNFDNIDFLKDQSINGIYEDRCGRIWIATDGNGLIVHDPAQKKFISINKLTGMQGTFARGILEDENNNIWISGIDGLYNIFFTDSRHSIASNSIGVRKISTYNGLRNNEFSRAVTNLPHGYLFFGGYNGGVMFRPSSLVENSFVPPIVITGIQIGNMPNMQEKILSGISPIYTSSISIPYKYTYFSLRFSALNYINSKGNNYAYRMEGLKDETWHYIGQNREVTYSDLSPGTYVFMVKAANNDNVWNSRPLKLYITILPPLWQTWYAYIFYFLTSFTLIYWFISNYRRTTALKNELHLQQLRNKLDQEFVEKKVNFYTHISHEIKTPLSLIVAPLDRLLDLLHKYEDVDGRLKTYLSIMKRNSEKLMGLIRQLLDYRRIESGRMELDLQQYDFSLFISNVVSNFQLLAKEKAIQLQYVTTNKYLLFTFDADKMEQVLNNLLSNAIKFTPINGCVKIILSELKLEEDREAIELIVEDNGCGIEPSLLDNLFEPFHYYDKKTANGSGIGLTYTKALVELHGGSIKVESHVGNEDDEGFTKFKIFFMAS